MWNPNLSWIDLYDFGRVMKILAETLSSYLPAMVIANVYGDEFRKKFIWSLKVVIAYNQQLARIDWPLVTDNWQLRSRRDRFGLYGQVTKRARWMPWQSEAMKDVVICDKLRGVDKQTLIRRFPNGETHSHKWVFLSWIHRLWKANPGNWNI